MRKVSVLNGKLCAFIVGNGLTGQLLMACRREDASETLDSVRLGIIRARSLS
jgi:hypothetical protein